MGVDIYLFATNQDVLDNSKQKRTRSHNLSRTFGYFMSRQGVVEGEPELDQIGRLINIDIAPLYEMEKYVTEDDLQYWLEYENEEDKPEIVQRVEADRASVEGNIDRVASTIEAMLTSLAAITNLPQLLTDNGHDTLNHQVYFADFAKDNDNTYTSNNFGQDLRNFKSFLDYVKGHGTNTVFFVYG